MTAMFSPSNSHATSNGTCNETWLLSAADTPAGDWLAWLKTVRPAAMYNAFGPGLDGCDIDYKGYYDFEWYFVCNTTKDVFGIGWRHGACRLRGRPGVIASREERMAAALNFAIWLRNKLENNESISRENV